MLSYQLPTQEVDYLDLVLPSSGIGLVARWGTQFTPRTVATWDEPESKPKWKKTAELLFLSPDGKWVSQLDRETGEMKITQVGGKKPTVLSRGKVEDVSTAVAPGGAVVAWKHANQIIVRSLPSGDPVAQVKSGWGANLQFSPGGRWLTEQGVRVFRVFDRTNNYRLFASIKTPRHIIADVTDDLTAVITTPDRSTVSVWDLSQKKVMATLSVGGWACTLAISPDGKQVLTGNTDGDFTLWDVKGNRLREYDWGIACPIAATFSQDGTRAAVGGTDGKIVVWDLDD